MNYEGKV